METDHIQSCKPHPLPWFHHHHPCKGEGTKWQGHTATYPQEPAWTEVTLRLKHFFTTFTLRHSCWIWRHQKLNLITRFAHSDTPWARDSGAPSGGLRSSWDSCRMWDLRIWTERFKGPFSFLPIWAVLSRFTFLLKHPFHKDLLHAYWAKCSSLKAAWARFIHAKHTWNLFFQCKYSTIGK